MFLIKLLNYFAILGQSPNEKKSEVTFDNYECSGIVDTDFPRLCVLLDMLVFPGVITKRPVTDNRPPGPLIWKQRFLRVELESQDPLTAMKLEVFGWKVDDRIIRVLQKMIPSLSNLRVLYFWQAGLKDRMVKSLMNAIPLCSNLSTVLLEGNPIPEHSYHLLLSEDSPLTKLSLRNNRIGDEGARLIGLALSTYKSANRKLLSLNLNYNSIGDAGAKCIAAGLRWNRTLVSLSLIRNKIGDSGAAHLAAVLRELALTHEEVVYRRKLLYAINHPEASKKNEKPAASKENGKTNEKASDEKVPQTEGEKLGNEEKQLSTQEENPSAAVHEVERGRSPLLDAEVTPRDGDLFAPGNATLVELDLSYNLITQRVLPLILTALEGLPEGEGLQLLYMHRNRFPPECETYLKIREEMISRLTLQSTDFDQNDEKKEE
ncbi:leucine-rich repeat-containing protein 71 isoform X2 [Antennarius striatus]|uniref:leucine-rich repeat-containing protein 71 isoform X2 n=1 Tax=Antennarius striatus TaxID=241820 RepID=UPI0035B4B16F